MGALGACEPCHWRLQWSFLLGHEPCEGVTKWAQWAHANAAIWASGAPTKRVRGVPKQRHAESKGKDEEGEEEEGERGALSLQNEDPTPQDGWE